MVARDLYDFESLKLVDKPDCDANVALPQTLRGSEGYLERWPLKEPNADPKIPATLADMVNILTDPEAEENFQTALNANVDTSHRNDETLAQIYNHKTSTVMKELIKQSHRRTSHVRAPGILGHVVNPGCLSFYKLDGRTFAAAQGRWILLSPKAYWIRKNESVDQDKIAPPKSQVLIIRVPPGSVGLIYDQGSEVLLGVGTHVFNSGTVTFKGTKKYRDFEHLYHGRFNYVRVERGQLGRVWVEVTGPDGVKSVQPRLLKEGEHFAESHLFKFDGMNNVSDRYIAHGSVHRISVQKGLVAKIYNNNTPRLLGEGDHIIESTAFSYDGTEDIMESPCISHGTITILRVTRGSVALVWQDNEPTFFDQPGLFEFDSPDFSFVEFKNAEEQLIQLGAKKIILVHTGQVAVTYDQGQLKILTDGRHTIDSATHVFHRFLSTQQRSIRLATVSREYKMAQRASRKKKAEGGAQNYKGMSDPDSDLTVCETKDLVKVGLRADVFYSIHDPTKCIQRIDTDELEDLVQETAIATLTNIIRSTALNEIAQSKNVSAGEKKDEGGKLEVLAPPPGPDAPPPTAPVEKFFDKVHDDFLDRLNEDFMERYGVDIANIRIESFKIMDEELSNSIAKHALTTAQIENELANLEGASIISTTRETTAAQVMKINAEAEAAKLKTAADAENQRQVDAAEASARAHKIEIQARAEAEAEAILIKAKAEAEAIRLKAEAEAKRAEMLSRTELGVQEALLCKYAEMVVGSNQGVEKVVYLDPSVNRDSPFALGSLNNLNMDLHALSKVGLAAGQHISQN